MDKDTHMTTAQEDVAVLFALLAPNGEVCVRLRGTRYRPDLVCDGRLLSACGCPRYFDASEYDAVLKKVSDMGLSLVTVED